MNKKKVEIVVLSRNRPHFLVETIRSVLSAEKRGQKVADCQIIISDNSDDKKCIDSIQDLYKNNRIIIRKRRQKLDIYEHFKKVIDEAKSEYIIIFHDDDIMLPNFIEDLYSIIDYHPECIAVACNAVKIDEFKNRYKNLWRPRLKDRPSKLMNANLLIEAYFSYGSNGICPFPGYIYRTKLIKGQGLDFKKGGKHSDVSFIYELTKYGQIIWTSNICMEYRSHGNNDSSVISLNDQLSLLRFLRIENYNNQYLKVYRFRIWLNYLINVEKNIENKKSNKYKSARKFVVFSYLSKFIWSYNFISYLLSNINWKRFLQKNE